MKLVLLSLIILYSNLAFSAPVPLTPGTYRFADFKVVLKKRFETVYASNDQGRKRMKELFQQNYTCEHTGREIFLCSHFESVENTKAEVSAKIQQEIVPRISAVDEHNTLPVVSLFRSSAF